ncbi:MAG TPA: DNA helicase UvrD, partial [Planctomycetaceae bacterium]|nr:DNA helicase UvrD [Planctomycetaceae bacterium]
LVDEYQDTNLAQYRIVHALSQHCPNVCVTGDPDQSIYGWRGARPGNILQFEQDFPQTRIVSLDQNFRSTGSIVACAERLISHNQRRHRNPLFTHNPEGSPPGLTVVSNAEAEAELLASQIAA